MNPTTISEEPLKGGARFVLRNARPRNMKVLVMVAAPIVLVLLAITAANDIQQHRWPMAIVRALFGVVVATAATFTLFGEESLDVAAGELWWRRGKNFERRCPVADIERLEREGNQLRVIVKSQPPIVIGSGLRQPPETMAWLADRVEAVLKAARSAGDKNSRKKKK